MACDNLVGADVITAEGQLVRATSDENPDLFWALRGGGGNFGAVTALDFRLHPVGTVLAGALLFPGSRAADILACYAEWAPEEPDELCSLIEFATAPDDDYIEPAHRGQPIVALAFCYCGPVADGEAAIARWRTAAPIVADLVEPMPYTTMQAFFDEAYPKGLWSHMKSHYLDDLTPDAIAALVDAATDRPAGRSIIDLHHLGGAASRVADGDTAFDHRHANYAVLLGAVSDDPSGIGECTDWAQHQWSALVPHASGGAYENFVTDNDDTAVRSAWTSRTADRLAAVKHRYDPDNRFRFNHNIRPDRS
jgi:hypothetical protein